MADRWQSQGSDKGAAAADVGNGGERQPAEERQGGRYYGRARSRRERRSRSWDGERGGSRGRGWRQEQTGRVELGAGQSRPFGGSEYGNREYGPGSYGRHEYGQSQGRGGHGRGQTGYGWSQGDDPESREGYGRTLGDYPESRGGYGESQGGGYGSGRSFRSSARQDLADRPGRDYRGAERGFPGGWERGRGEPFGETGRGRTAGGWGDAESREETGRWRGAWGASPWSGWSGPGLYGAEGTVESGRQSARPQGRWQREALTAGEIMTRGIKAVTKQSTLNNVAQVMKDENCGIVPVVDESHKLLGVVTDRDIVVRALASDGGTAQTTVESVMTDDVDAVAPDDEVRDVIELMGQKQIRRVPVVDRNDRLVGIIAMADIANRADYDEDLQDALERISSKRSFWNRLWS